MVRTKTNVPRHRRVKRLMKRARGYYQGRHRLVRTAQVAVERSDHYAFRDRRVRKRDFRRLWITRISAACRARGISYSDFIHALDRQDVRINRKQLSELAIHDPDAFSELVESAKKTLERAVISDR